MMQALIYLIVLCVVVGVAWWILDFVPVPEPLNRIAKVVIIVVALLIVISLLLGLLGGGGVPRLTG